MHMVVISIHYVASNTDSKFVSHPRHVEVADVNRSHTTVDVRDVDGLTRLHCACIACYTCVNMLSNRLSNMITLVKCEHVVKCIQLNLCFYTEMWNCHIQRPLAHHYCIVCSNRIHKTTQVVCMDINDDCVSWG
jgi:hypothetical protein